MQIITIPSRAGSVAPGDQAPVLDSSTELVTVIKDEFNRRDLGHGIRLFQSGEDDQPPGILASRVIADCFENCIIFLVHGTFGVDGPIIYTNPSYAYRVQGETWVRLYGHTTILVIEKEESIPACRKAAEELRAKHLGEEKKAAKPLTKLKKKLSKMFGLDG